MYDTMKIVATACDGISECAGNLDEAGCGDKNYGTFVSAILMLVLFAVLKIWEYCRNDENSETDQKKIVIYMNTKKQTENDQTDIIESNLELLNVLYTKDKAARIEDGIASKQKRLHGFSKLLLPVWCNPVQCNPTKEDVTNIRQ